MCIIHYTQYGQCQHVELLAVSKCGGALQIVQAALPSRAHTSLSHRKWEDGLDKKEDRRPHSNANSWGNHATHRTPLTKDSLIAQFRVLNQRKNKISPPLPNLDEQPPERNLVSWMRHRIGIMKVRGERQSSIARKLYAGTDENILRERERPKHLWHFLGSRQRCQIAPQRLPCQGCRLRVRHVISSERIGWCGPCNWDAYQNFLRMVLDVKEEATSRTDLHLKATPERKRRKLLSWIPEFQPRLLFAIPESWTKSPILSHTLPKRPPHNRPGSPIQWMRAIAKGKLKEEESLDMFGIPWSSPEILPSPTMAAGEDGKVVREEENAGKETAPTGYRPGFFQGVSRTPISPRRFEARPSIHGHSTQEAPPPLRHRSILPVKKWRKLGDPLANSPYPQNRSFDNSESRNHWPRRQSSKTYTVVSPYSSHWPTTHSRPPTPGIPPRMNLDSVVLSPMPGTYASSSDGFGSRWLTYLPPDKAKNPISWRPGSPAGTNPNRSIAVYSHAGSRESLGALAKYFATRESTLRDSAMVSPLWSSVPEQPARLVLEIPPRQPFDGILAKPRRSVARTSWVSESVKSWYSDGIEDQINDGDAEGQAEDAEETPQEVRHAVQNSSAGVQEKRDVVVGNHVDTEADSAQPDRLEDIIDIYLEGTCHQNNRADVGCEAL